VERSRVRLVEGAIDRYRNQSVDLLFNSVASRAKKRFIGVVLRGSLSDGSQGLAAIHCADGATMVLGFQGVAAEGMPLNAIR
jgi:chemotaxis response regulator CheB